MFYLGKANGAKGGLKLRLYLVLRYFATKLLAVCLLPASAGSIRNIRPVGSIWVEGGYFRYRYFDKINYDNPIFNISASNSFNSCVLI